MKCCPMTGVNVTVWDHSAEVKSTSAALWRSRGETVSIAGEWQAMHRAQWAESLSSECE